MDRIGLLGWVLVLCIAAQAAALQTWTDYLAAAEALPEEAQFLEYARERIAALGGGAP